MDDAELARLLSGRDRPSVLEKEQMLEHIEQEVEREQAASRPRVALRIAAWGAPLAAAAALALWWFAPAREPELAARGTAHAPQVAPPVAASLSVRCLRSGAPAPCRRGGALGFVLAGVGERRHFAALSVRADGTVLWYLPAPSERSLELSPGAGEQAVERLIELGDEHAEGHYAVYGVLSDGPLTRAQVRAALGPAREGDGSVTVLRTTLQILADEAAP